MKKFQKRIYVKREYPSDPRGAPWLVAQESIDGIVEADESVPVAIYELVKVLKATAKTQLE